MKLIQRILSLGCGLIVCSGVQAQFAPQAGIAGSSAIPHNSPDIVAWATGCTVQRGYLDIANPSAGRAISGEASMGTGAPDNQVVSLGDSGVAILTFPGFIFNGPGPDFAVFENGFTHPQDPELGYLELAFVEVSSDGVNFTRFPASCHIQDTQQIAGAGMFINARQIHNLAGKYKARFGTPFDLEDLVGTPGLDVNRITHVRIVDVVGSLHDAHASKDKDGNKINDPYPTPFDVGTGGFDLDAVGVMHQSHTSVPPVAQAPLFRIYPNPVGGMLHVQTEETSVYSVTITDVIGRQIYLGTGSGMFSVPFESYPQGVYYITLKDVSGQQWTECVAKQ